MGGNYPVSLKDPLMLGAEIVGAGALNAMSVGDFERINSIELISNIFFDPPSIPSFCYNDVRLEPYQGCVDAYMSFQRNRLAIGDL